MNSFRVRIFLCCVPAIFATGCPTAPSDPCNGNCDAGQICVAGICEVRCDDDDGDDCAPGQFCVDGICGETCETADDCECDSDADCDDQEACTSDTCAGQICLSAPISCNTAADCPTGCDVSCNALFFCSNSVDVCASCGPDEFCIFGPLGFGCVECLDDADCDGGEICDGVNGDCVECISNSHCNGGEICDEATNTCVGCDFNDECNDNNACTTDFCSNRRCFNNIIFCVGANECPSGCGVCAQDGVCSN